MDLVIFYSSKFISFFLLFTVIILFFQLIFTNLLKKNPEKHLKFYGFLHNLNNSNIFLLSFVIVRYIFFIWCLFCNDYVKITEDYHFYFLLLLSITYDIFSKKFYGILPDILNNAIIYVALFSKMVLFNYIVSVNSIFYVIVILSLLIIFTFLYVSYFSLKDIEYVLKCNQYAKKKGDA